MSSNLVWNLTRDPATPSSDYVNHLYDYRPNWTPLSPVTIINEDLHARGKTNSEYVKEVTWSPNTHLSPVTGSTLLKVSLSRIVSVGTSINTTLKQPTTLMSNHINVLICAYVSLVHSTTKSRFEIFNLKRFHNNEFPGQLNDKEYLRIDSANAKQQQKNQAVHKRCTSGMTLEVSHQHT